MVSGRLNAPLKLTTNQNMHLVIERFIQAYECFDSNTIEALPSLYHNDIEFCDPVHCIHGITALQGYFNGMLTQLISCRFEIKQTWLDDDSASISWVMHYAHPKINSGKIASLNGISIININADLITKQVDYYDMGAMLYEHIPLLGRLLKLIKSRLQ